MVLLKSLLVTLLSSSVAGFGVAPLLQTSIRRPTATTPTTTTLWGIRCENKFYQLEEMEDKDTATTELFLRDDNWIDFGDSDGPVPAQVDGYWSVAPGTDDFEMTVKRLFQTGSDNSDMGEFTFEVIRKYVGQMTLVGESVAITGVMLNVDEVLGDEEVGFFNMIDGTNERQGYENQSVRATGY